MCSTVIDIKTRKKTLFQGRPKTSEANSTRTPANEESELPCTPNTRLLAMLAALYEKAECGELQSLVVAGVLNDNAVIDGWALNPKTVPPYAMVGALDILKNRLAEALIENAL